MDALIDQVLRDLTDEIRHNGADTVTLPDVLNHNAQEGWYMDGDNGQHMGTTLPEDVITCLYWRAVDAAQEG